MKSQDYFSKVFLFLMLAIAVIATACGNNSKGFVDETSQADATSDASADASPDTPPPPPNPNYTISVSRVSSTSSSFLDFKVEVDTSAEVEVSFFLLRDGATIPTTPAAFQKAVTVVWADGSSEALQTFFKTRLSSSSPAYIWFAHDNDGGRPLDPSRQYKLYYVDSDPGRSGSAVHAGDFSTDLRRASVEPIREAPNNLAGSSIRMPYGSLIHSHLLITNRISVQINGVTINDVNATNQGSEILNIGGVRSRNFMDYDLTGDNEIEFLSKINGVSETNNGSVVYRFLADTSSNVDNEAGLTINFF